MIRLIKKHGYVALQTGPYPVTATFYDTKRQPYEKTYTRIDLRKELGAARIGKKYGRNSGGLLMNPANPCYSPDTHQCTKDIQQRDHEGARTKIYVMCLFLRRLMFRPHGGIIALIFLISSYKMQRTSEVPRV